MASPPVGERNDVAFMASLVCGADAPRVCPFPFPSFCLSIGLPVRGPVWPASQNTSTNRPRGPRLAEAGRGSIGRGGPRLEAALSLIWRWRGVSKLEDELAEAYGRLVST